MPRAERQASQFLDVIERLPYGVVVIDHQARVAYATTLAIKMITDGGGLSLTSRGLRARDLAADRRLQAAIAGGPLAHPIGEPISIPRDFSVSPLVLRVLPIAVATLDPQLDEHAALIFLSDPTRSRPRDAALLIALFRRTRAEATVALRVADGLGPTRQSCLLHHGTPRSDQASESESRQDR